MSINPVPRPIEHFFELAPDAIIVANQDQVVMEWNHKAIITFGFEKNEAIGRPLAQLIVPEKYRTAHKRGVEHFLKTGESTVLNRSFEITALHKNGRQFPISLNISNVRIGDEWQFIAFISDISERRAQQEKLKLQHEALKSIANIQSHEIRGPLASIMGLMNIVRDNNYSMSHTELQLMETAVNQLDERIRKIVNQTYL